MLLAAGYIAVLFHVPLGRSVLPLGSVGTPVTIGVLIINLLVDLSYSVIDPRIRYS